MIGKRKTMLLLFLVICLIGTIMIYRKNEPKNIFEEIYEAEMSAAETNCTIDKRTLIRRLSKKHPFQILTILMGQKQR